ncbi:MAG: hypothetical protein LBD23_13885, partial [Oscillospiraceae bacterium]|nr:hypothetical protein [Oscillospiraceae bacterium]
FFAFTMYAFHSFRYHIITTLRLLYHIFCDVSIIFERGTNSSMMLLLVIKKKSRHNKPSIR